MSFNLKHPKESFHNTSITLDCDLCTIVTHHGKQNYNKVSIRLLIQLILVFFFSQILSFSYKCMHSFIYNSFSLFFHLYFLFLFVELLIFLDLLSAIKEKQRLNCFSLRSLSPLSLFSLSSLSLFSLFSL